MNNEQLKAVNKEISELELQEKWYLRCIPEDEKLLKGLKIRFGVVSRRLKLLKEGLK